jgi:hypothetical protein
LQTELLKVQAATKNELLRQLRNIEQLKAQAEALYGALEQLNNRDKNVHDLHRISAAILYLERALATSVPVGEELSKFKEATSADPLYSAVLASLPTALSSSGVPTLSELQVRFVGVREEVSNV